MHKLAYTILIWDNKSSAIARVMKAEQKGPALRAAIRCMRAINVTHVQLSCFDIDWKSGEPQILREFEKFK